MLPSDWLIANGWTKGCEISPYPKGGCLVNAMVATGHDENRFSRAIEDILAVTGMMKVFDWNDQECPDTPTAVAVMRQVEINLGLRPVDVSEPTNQPLTKPDLPFITCNVKGPNIK